jgi:hypothetical protein
MENAMNRYRGQFGALAQATAAGAMQEADAPRLGERPDVSALENDTWAIRAFLYEEAARGAMRFADFTDPPSRGRPSRPRRKQRERLARAVREVRSRGANLAAITEVLGCSTVTVHGLEGGARAPAKRKRLGARRGRGEDREGAPAELSPARPLTLALRGLGGPSSSHHLHACPLPQRAGEPLPAANPKRTLGLKASHAGSQRTRRRRRRRAQR